jgi:acyl-CoA thioesterase FadM
MKHTEKYRARYHDTDRNFNLTLFHISRYMQETAFAAFDLLDAPRREITDKGFAFILTKISFSFESVIKKFDEIRVETWALPIKSVTYIRNYRIIDETARVCAVRAATAWALISVEDKRIVHPRALSENFTALTDDEEIGFAPVRKIKMPDDINVVSAGNLLFTKDVLYSDIDENMHMNNTVYLDIIQNALSKALQGDPLDRLRTLDLTFNSGAVEGDRVSIYGVKITGEHGVEVFISGICNGVNCFDAAAHYE